jgi:hypothetical protein
MLTIWDAHLHLSSEVTVYQIAFLGSVDAGSGGK